MRRPCAWRALSRPGLAVRGLGAIYLVAFTSLRRQVRGLYGARGILPAREYLAAIAAALPDGETRTKGQRRAVWAARLHAAPSLLWLDASDRGLGRLCTAGELAAGAMVLGVGGRLPPAICWATYLSFFTVGREFLRFQWDVLLLEAGAAGDARAPAAAADAAARCPAAARVGCREARLPRSDLARPQRLLPSPGDAAAADARGLVRAPPAGAASALRHRAHAGGRVRSARPRLRPPSRAPPGVRGPHGISGSHRPHRQLRLLQLADRGPEPGDPRATRRQPAKTSRARAGVTSVGCCLGCSAGSSTSSPAAHSPLLGLADLTDRLQLQQRLGPRVWAALDRLAQALSPLRLGRLLRPLLDDDDHASRDRRRGLRRRRRRGASMRFATSPATSGAGRAGWRPTSRASTGRCGSPRSGLRRAGSCASSGACSRARPTCSPCSTAIPSPTAPPASSGRSSTTIASPISARTGGRAPTGCGGGWGSTFPSSKRGRDHRP